MPLCTLSLVTLRDGEREDVAKRFVTSIIQAGVRPVLAGHYKRRVIAAEKIDVEVLRGHVLVIVEGTDGLPEACRGDVVAEYRVYAGIPSGLLFKFPETNRKLLSAPAPPLTGSLNKPRLAQSTQLLEANDALIQWARNGPRTPITMLNLLAFREGMHETYLKYGKVRAIIGLLSILAELSLRRDVTFPMVVADLAQAFGESIGAKRGGNAKIVGRVVAPPQGKRDSRTTDGKFWDEIACAHCPLLARRTA